MTVLDEVLGRPFALLHRPMATGPDRIELLLGPITEPRTLAEVPDQDVLVVVPYRQIIERGFTCVDDGSPLIAMQVTSRAVLPTAEVLSQIPDPGIQLSAGRFDTGDDAYAEIVRAVLASEIGAGMGSNFVVKRSFVAEISDFSPAVALTFFRRLYEREAGAYWTFVVHTGTRTFVGATPERHVSLTDGLAVMNPISGTYRYPSSGPTLHGLLDFLADGKETDELHMVVDEELKMMSRVCQDGVRVVGPYLREMARLAHTEYLIEGITDLRPQEILRETMFAPTVTGSPLENAFRVIERYERRGRGYYGGIIALISRDSLDSAVLIRTADISSRGRLEIGVGATLVRHSDPLSEVAETHAKVAGLLTAFEHRICFGEHAEVRSALRRRQADLAAFWRTGPGSVDRALAGRRVLVVDAEDTFTAMLRNQLQSLGLSVTVRRYDEPYTWDGYDLVIMGPGPGDPRDTNDPRIAHLHEATRSLLASRRPFVAVCLSHQVVCHLLGFPLRRRSSPNQGTRHTIDLFGTSAQVGFYNTFEAHGTGPADVAVSRDPRTGEVHALRGPHFATMQFHAESVLTQDGPRILVDQLRAAIGAPVLIP